MLLDGSSVRKSQRRVYLKFDFSLMDITVRECGPSFKTMPSAMKTGSGGPFYSISLIGQVIHFSCDHRSISASAFGAESVLGVKSWVSVVAL